MYFRYAVLFSQNIFVVPVTLKIEILNADLMIAEFTEMFNLQCVRYRRNATSVISKE